MYVNSKDVIRCPICDAFCNITNGIHYVCTKCNWDSLENTVDVSYKDPLSAPLSNLFPHTFTICNFSNLPSQAISIHRLYEVRTKIECQSMESFIQSLRVKDPDLQAKICETYSGYMAYKLRLTLNDWRKDGIVYWQGQAIDRNSPEYTKLITDAYDCLYMTNSIFRNLVLPKYKGQTIIHSIGNASTTETLLTEGEFRYQITRLINKV